jgi:hypothetical protein
LHHLHVIARESGRSSNHLIRRGLLDAPLSPEVGLGRLRQLLGERNRKHPISRGMTPL